MAGFSQNATKSSASPSLGRASDQGSRSDAARAGQRRCTPLSSGGFKTIPGWRSASSRVIASSRF